MNSSSSYEYTAIAPEVSLQTNRSPRTPTSIQLKVLNPSTTRVIWRFVGFRISHTRNVPSTPPYNEETKWNLLKVAYMSYAGGISHTVQSHSVQIGSTD